MNHINYLICVYKFCKNAKFAKLKLRENFPVYGTGRAHRNSWHHTKVSNPIVSILLCFASPLSVKEELIIELANQIPGNWWLLVFDWLMINSILTLFLHWQWTCKAQYCALLVRCQWRKSINIELANQIPGNSWLLVFDWPIRY